MPRRSRPRMTPMDELLGGPPAAAADLDRVDAESRYLMLVDEARDAMTAADPLRGYPAAESVRIAVALLVRADASRP